MAHYLIFTIDPVCKNIFTTKHWYLFIRDKIMSKHNRPIITVLLVSASCKIGSAGENYVGTIAVTKNGDTCQRWDSNTPNRNRHQEISLYPGVSSLSELKNYCRNPDGDLHPWCYKNTSIGWNFCSIPCCSRSGE